MILEPKHKNFKIQIKNEETVKKMFNIRRHISIVRAFEWYPFQAILNWWHSPFKRPTSQDCGDLFKQQLQALSI
jgi:hypothetical protein